MELMHKCFLTHSHLGTARMKQDKETEEGKKREVRMKISKAGMKKKKNHNGLSLPNQDTIIINIICKYFIRYGKITKKIQLPKNKMDLNIKKNRHHPPSSRNIIIINLTHLIQHIINLSHKSHLANLISFAHLTVTNNSLVIITISPIN